MDDEIYFIFQTPVRILKFFGLWINKKSSIFYKVYGILVHLLFFEIYGFFMTMYLTKSHGLAIYAEVMSLLPAYFSCAIKTINFMTRVDEIEELFMMIKNCAKDFEIDRKFRKDLIEVNWMYKAFWGGATFSVLLTIVSTLLSQTISVRMWFPFEVDTPFRFWIVVIIQNLNSLSYTAVNMAVVIFPVFFMCYIAGLFELLCKQLESLKEQSSLKLSVMQKPKIPNQTVVIVKPKEPTNREKLLKCIEIHLKIIELVRKVQKLFSTVIFIEGLISTFVLCTTSFLLTIISPQMQTVIFLKVFFLLMTWLLQILLPCYYSERITCLSGELSTSLFHSDWMMENREYQKLVVFFMQNAKRPIKMSALGIFEIDLETFMKIANTAYSFYAVFKRSDVKKKHGKRHHE
ncbi:hypothetical protein PVAND_012791 [Polypedilum vanderplanki]|uniref:Odorant receptor n=1 Tax=Polypedilum vanderplanki TaxID=319348 RepID=A0A9J6CNH3_POLVA|nr:hypothetical protein PVAND_012791 [Polypedilum vanderplanki]